MKIKKITHVSVVSILFTSLYFYHVLFFVADSLGSFLLLVNVGFSIITLMFKFSLVLFKY